jgi:hypothetical protein
MQRRDIAEGFELLAEHLPGVEDEPRTRAGRGTLLIGSHAWSTHVRRAETRKLTQIYRARRRRWLSPLHPGG